MVQKYYGEVKIFRHTGWGHGSVPCWPLCYTVQHCYKKVYICIFLEEEKKFQYLMWSMGVWDMSSEMIEGPQCLCSLGYLYGYEKKIIKTFNESQFLLPSIPRILKI